MVGQVDRTRYCLVWRKADEDADEAESYHLQQVTRKQFPDFVASLMQGDKAKANVRIRFISSDEARKLQPLAPVVPAVDDPDDDAAGNEEEEVRAPLLAAEDEQVPDLPPPYVLTDEQVAGVDDIPVAEDAPVLAYEKKKLTGGAKSSGGLGIAWRPSSDPREAGWSSGQNAVYKPEEQAIDGWLEAMAGVILDAACQHSHHLAMYKPVFAYGLLRDVEVIREGEVVPLPRANLQHMLAGFKDAWKVLYKGERAWLVERLRYGDGKKPWRVDGSESARAKNADTFKRMAQDEEFRTSAGMSLFVSILIADYSLNLGNIGFTAQGRKLGRVDFGAALRDLLAHDPDEPFSYLAILPGFKSHVKARKNYTAMLTDSTEIMHAALEHAQTIFADNDDGVDDGNQEAFLAKLRVDLRALINNTAFITKDAVFELASIMGLFNGYDDEALKTAKRQLDEDSSYEETIRRSIVDRVTAQIERRLLAMKRIADNTEALFIKMRDSDEYILKPHEQKQALKFYTTEIPSLVRQLKAALNQEEQAAILAELVKILQGLKAGHDQEKSPEEIDRIVNLPALRSQPALQFELRLALYRHNQIARKLAIRRDLTAEDVYEFVIEDDDTLETKLKMILGAVNNRLMRLEHVAGENFDPDRRDNLTAQQRRYIENLEAMKAQLTIALDSTKIKPEVTAAVRELKRLCAYHAEWLHDKQAIETWLQGQGDVVDALTVYQYSLDELQYLAFLVDTDERQRELVDVLDDRLPPPPPPPQGDDEQPAPPAEEERVVIPPFAQHIVVIGRYANSLVNTFSGKDGLPEPILAILSKVRGMDLANITSVPDYCYLLRHLYLYLDKMPARLSEGDQAFRQACLLLHNKISDFLNDPAVQSVYPQTFTPSTAVIQYAWRLQTQKWLEGNNQLARVRYRTPVTKKVENAVKALCELNGKSVEVGFSAQERFIRLRKLLEAISEWKKKKGINYDREHGTDWGMRAREDTDSATLDYIMQLEFWANVELGEVQHVKGMGWQTTDRALTRDLEERAVQRDYQYSPKQGGAKNTGYYTGDYSYGGKPRKRITWKQGADIGETLAEFIGGKLYEVFIPEFAAKTVLGHWSDDDKREIYVGSEWSSGWDSGLVHDAFKEAGHEERPRFARMKHSKDLIGPLLRHNKRSGHSLEEIMLHVLLHGDNDSHTGNIVVARDSRNGGAKFIKIDHGFSLFKLKPKVNNIFSRFSIRAIRFRWGWPPVYFVPTNHAWDWAVNHKEFYYSEHFARALRKFSGDVTEDKLRAKTREALLEICAAFKNAEKTAKELIKALQVFATRADVKVDIKGKTPTEVCVQIENAIVARLMARKKSIVEYFTSRADKECLAQLKKEAKKHKGEVKDKLLKLREDIKALAKLQAELKATDDEVARLPVKERIRKLSLEIDRISKEFICTSEQGLMLDKKTVRLIKQMRVNLPNRGALLPVELLQLIEAEQEKYSEALARERLRNEQSRSQGGDDDNTMADTLVAYKACLKEIHEIINGHVPSEDKLPELLDRLQAFDAKLPSMGARSVYLAIKNYRYQARHTHFVTALLAQMNIVLQSGILTRDAKKALENVAKAIRGGKPVEQDDLRVLITKRNTMHGVDARFEKLSALIQRIKHYVNAEERELGAEDEAGVASRSKETTELLIRLNSLKELEEGADAKRLLTKLIEAIRANEPINRGDNNLLEEFSLAYENVSPEDDDPSLHRAVQALNKLIGHYVLHHRAEADHTTYETLSFDRRLEASLHNVYKGTVVERVTVGGQSPLPPMLASEHEAPVRRPRVDASSSSSSDSDDAEEPMRRGARSLQRARRHVVSFAHKRRQRHVDHFKIFPEGKPRGCDKSAKKEKGRTKFRGPEVRRTELDLYRKRNEHIEITSRDKFLGQNDLEQGFEAFVRSAPRDDEGNLTLYINSAFNSTQIRQLRILCDREDVALVFTREDGSPKPLNDRAKALYREDAEEEEHDAAFGRRAASRFDP